MTQTVDSAQDTAYKRPMTPIIKQLALGPMGNFIYVLGDPETKQGAVIDPGWEADTLLKAMADAGLTFTYVLMTHTHFDHTGALTELCEKGKPEAVYVHEAEASNLPDVSVPVRDTQDGTVLKLGRLTVRCLHTPGHSPGGQCLLVDRHAFVGDTLFVDGCGRVDLPGSDPETMWHSLQKIAALPEETVVYCGHNYGGTPTSTVGEQRRTNPYLSAESKSAFFSARGV